MKFSEYKLTDKNTAHDYGVRYYDQLFEPFLDKKIDLLELGVQHGGCILAFTNVLKQAQIFGIDKNLNQNKYKTQQEETRRVKLFEIELYTKNTKKLVDEQLGDQKFDIIIDDASHIHPHQLLAFEIFYKRLKSGGTYVIEDVLNKKALVEGIQKITKSGMIEVIDLREFKHKLTDDIIVEVKKPLFVTLL